MLSCCLPVAPVLAAVGLAGAGALLDPLRPYLTWLALGSLGFGLWQHWRAPRCHRGMARWNGVALWTSAALLGALLVFPQEVASLLADVLPAGDNQ